MDFLSSLVTNVLTPFMQNPLVQNAVVGVGSGVLVKFAVDQLKQFFKKVDEQGVPEGYKMPVQLLVMVCSALAALGDLALKQQLSTYDPNILVNFVTVALPAFIGAWGTQKLGNKAIEAGLPVPVITRNDSP